MICSSSTWAGSIASKVLNNNNLQLGTILTNEASVLESFFQISGMAG